MVFLVFTVFVPFEFIKSQGIVLFKLYKCIFIDEFVLPNSTCYAKPYNWTTSTINEYIYLKKPFGDHSVSLTKNIERLRLHIFPDWSYHCLQVRNNLPRSYETSEIRCLQNFEQHCPRQHFALPFQAGVRCRDSLWSCLLPLYRKKLTQSFQRILFWLLIPGIRFDKPHAWFQFFPSYSPNRRLQSQSLLYKEQETIDAKQNMHFHA